MGAGVSFVVLYFQETRSENECVTCRITRIAFFYYKYVHLQYVFARTQREMYIMKKKRATKKKFVCCETTMEHCT